MAAVIPSCPTAATGIATRSGHPDRHPGRRGPEVARRLRIPRVTPRAPSPGRGCTDLGGRDLSGGRVHHLRCPHWLVDAVGANLLGASWQASRIARASDSRRLTSMLRSVIASARRLSDFSHSPRQKRALRTRVRGDVAPGGHKRHGGEIRACDHHDPQWYGGALANPPTERRTRRKGSPAHLARHCPHQWRHGCVRG